VSDKLMLVIVTALLSYNLFLPACFHCW